MPPLEGGCLDILVDVERVGHGHLTETIEMDKAPDQWTSFEVFHFIGKLGWFIQSIGPALPTEVSVDPLMTSFRVKSLDGQTVVSAAVPGVPQVAVDDWRRLKPKD